MIIAMIIEIVMFSEKRAFLLEIMKLKPFKYSTILNIDEKNIENYNNSPSPPFFSSQILHKIYQLL